MSSLSNPLSSLGVAIGSIAGFLEMLGGADELDGFTTREVVHQYILPAVASKHHTQSVAELLAKEHPNPSLTTPTHFIVHTWEYLFMDTMNALLDSFEESPDTIIWIDIFSVNQAEVKVCVDYVHNFYNTVLGPISASTSTSTSLPTTTFTNILLVSSSIGNHILLKRTWCLLELYHFSLSSRKIPVDFCMTNQQWKKFRKDVLCVEATDMLIKLTQAPNIAESLTHDKADKDLIYDFMVNDRKVKEEKWNLAVTRVIRECILENIEKKKSFLVYLDEFDVAVKKNVKKIIGYLYEDQGNLLTATGQLGEAIDEFERCLEIKNDLAEMDDDTTLTVLKRMALLHARLDQNQKALSLFKDIYDRTKDKYGETHQFTLDALLGIAHMYTKLGEYEQACTWYSECYDKKKELLESHHIDILSLMEDLATMHYKLNKNEECISLLSSLLKVRSQLLPDDHLDIIETTEKLADAYTRINSLDKALPLYEGCMRKRRVLCGNDHINTLDSMAVLAHTHQMLGNFNLAIKFYEECMDGRTLLLGNDHPLTEYTMRKLADLFYVTKQFDRALPLYEFIFVQKEIMKTENTPETLQSISILASIYQGLERSGQAVPLYEEVLVRARELYLNGTDAKGKNKIENTMNILAGLYLQQEKYEESMKMYEEILEIEQERLSDDDDHLRELMIVLAGIYRQCNEYVKSVNMHTKLYESIRVQRGEHDDSTLETCMALADVYYENDQYKSALPLYDKIYSCKVEKGIDNDDDEEMYKLVCLCAGMYYDEENFKKALPYNERLLNIAKTRHGLENPAVIETMHILGDIYIQVSNYSKAMPMLSQCIELKKAVLGEKIDDEKGDVLMLTKVLMELYTNECMYKEAIPLYVDVLEVDTKSLGGEHGDVMHTQTLLGNAYLILKDWEEALPVYKSIHERRLKLLGRDDEKTVNAMNNLAFLYKTLGMLEEYAPLHKEVILARELARMENLKSGEDEDKADQYIFELKRSAMDLLEVSPPSALEVAAAIEKDKELDQKEVQNALKGISADGKKVEYKIVGRLAPDYENNGNS